MDKITPSHWAMLAMARELPFWLEPHVQASVRKILRARNPLYFAHLRRNFRAEQFWTLLYSMLWTNSSASRWFSYGYWRNAINYINVVIENIVLQHVKRDDARSRELVELARLLFAFQAYIKVYSHYTEIRVVRTSQLVFDPWPRIKIVSNERTDAYSYVELATDTISTVKGLEEYEKLHPFTIDWSWRICGFTTNYIYKRPNDMYIIRGIQYIFMNDPNVGATYIFTHKFGTSEYSTIELAVRSFLTNGWRTGDVSSKVSLQFLVLNGHTYWGYNVVPGPVAYTAITGIDTLDVLTGYATGSEEFVYRINASGMFSELNDKHEYFKKKFSHNQQLMRVFYPWEQSHGGICTLRLFQRAELDQENELFWYAPIMDYYAFIGVNHTNNDPYYNTRSILTYLKYRTDIDGREHKTYLTFTFQPATASDRIYCAHGCFHERTVAGLLARADAQAAETSKIADDA